MKRETVVNLEQVDGEHEAGKWMGALMLFMGAIFLLGTDMQGRALWSRICYATRVSLTIGLVVCGVGACTARRWRC